MSPDRALPVWARITGRILRAAVYALGIVVGLADLNAPSPVILDAVQPPWMHMWAWIATTAGVVGLLAVAAWRWRWEYVASAALGLALAARAIGVWSTVDESAVRVAAAASITIAALACLLRTLDLTVFAIRTSAAVIHTRGGVRLRA
ncbi:hypothetical protein [Cellulomonas gilvus]|uniref:Uncharacterized protein n=1 Tax=Cellulomonas gilvus (strain ATCC 13127 / NRRL B-14078) TaxID=593907 RepID=F8A2E8_CELGA|nr:hypothetical protein [Cellulomonas gilvus]AEI11805.1 hypothetical protein Celgi_1286 [Cellulomonas gilvus ATCC 13127]